MFMCLAICTTCAYHLAISISEESLFVDAVKLSVVQTAVFYMNIIWYCDETTIALIGFLKVAQVSESMPSQVERISLRLYSLLVDFASSLLRFAQVAYKCSVGKDYRTSSFWSACPHFSWEMK